MQTRPKITINRIRAEQLGAIPFTDLAHTVIASDFDLTVKYPRFIPNPKAPHLLLREGAMLRGGAASLAIMQKLKAESWGYYLVSAAPASRLGAEALTAELRNIYAPEKMDLSFLFAVNQSQQSEYILFDNENQIEQFKQCYIAGDLVLNGYNKAAGTVLRIKSETEKSAKISRIIFIDDFVMNAYYFPEELLKYLNNIKEHLADELEIVSVWLDPSCEFTSNLQLKKIVTQGSENSYFEEYRVFQEHFTQAAINTKEFIY